MNNDVSLVTCLYCGEKVSEKATNCPKCNYINVTCRKCGDRIPFTQLMRRGYPNLSRESGYEARPYSDSVFHETFYHVRCVDEILDQGVGVECDVCREKLDRSWVNGLFVSKFPKPYFDLLTHLPVCSKCGHPDPIRDCAGRCDKCGLPIYYFTKSFMHGEKHYHVSCCPELAKAAANDKAEREASIKQAAEVKMKQDEIRSRRRRLRSVIAMLAVLAALSYGAYVLCTSIIRF